MKDMEFDTKEELLQYLVENKTKLKNAKKSAIKHSDAIDFCKVMLSEKSDTAIKADDSDEDMPDEGTLNVKVVINTSNLVDSHSDCHIPGLWKRSLKNNPTSVHLREHQRTLDYVITDKAIPSVKMMSWADLGLKYEGKTQALIFDSNIQEERNSFMFKQYSKGWVKQHSVGMMYVDLYLCVNSKEKWAEEEKANWDKYYPEVANKDRADESGYFWAVTEAKFIEGSAVVFGSNSVTPTLSVKTNQTISTEDTHSEIPKDVDENEIKTASTEEILTIFKQSLKLN